MASCVCFCGKELASALPPGAKRCGSEEYWQLCGLSASEVPCLTEHPLHCRTLLVPEGTYRPIWQAEQVVSYGLSGRSTLTLSSMGQRDLLCIQRTMTDCRGRPVEAQELRLSDSWGVFFPADRLLLAGMWLLWAGAMPDAGK